MNEGGQVKTMNIACTGVGGYKEPSLQLNSTLQNCNYAPLKFLENMHILCLNLSAKDDNDQVCFLYLSLMLREVQFNVMLEVISTLFILIVYHCNYSVSPDHYRC